MPSASTSRSCWSATISSCPRSRRAAGSRRSPHGCRRSSCARTAGRSRRGSATRSPSCGPATRRRAAGRYEAARRVRVAEDATGVRGALVADWWRAGDVDGALMLAQRRIDVADLNGRAHALRRAAGQLGPDELPVGGVGIAAGDWVMLRRNDKRARRRQRRPRRGRRGRRRRRQPGGRHRRPARRARSRVPLAGDAAGRRVADLRLRDDRAPRPGHDVPADVRAGLRRAVARGRLRGAESRQGGQPPLPGGGGAAGARRVRPGGARRARSARGARQAAVALAGAAAGHRRRRAAAEGRRAPARRARRRPDARGHDRGLG